MLSLLVLIALSSPEVESLPQVPDSVTPLEPWNPITWWYPLRIAQAESWSSYLKEAQRATSRLYKLVRNYVRSVRLINRLQAASGSKLDQQKQNRTAGHQMLRFEVGTTPTGDDAGTVQGERPVTVVPQEDRA